MKFQNIIALKEEKLNNGGKKRDTGQIIGKNLRMKFQNSSR